MNLAKPVRIDEFRGPYDLSPWLSSSPCACPSRHTMSEIRELKRAVSMCTAHRRNVPCAIGVSLEDDPHLPMRYALPPASDYRLNRAAPQILP